MAVAIPRVAPPVAAITIPPPAPVIAPIPAVIPVAWTKCAEASCSVTVQAACNAQPCKLEVISCPSPVVAGETKTYTFRLTNTGTKTQTYKIEVYINDELVAEGSGTLSGGASGDISLDITWPAPGDYVLKLVAYTC